MYYFLTKLCKQCIKSNFVVALDSSQEFIFNYSNKKKEEKIVCTKMSVVSVVWGVGDGVVPRLLDGCCKEQVLNNQVTYNHHHRLTHPHIHTNSNQQLLNYTLHFLIESKIIQTFLYAVGGRRH